MKTEQVNVLLNKGIGEATGCTEPMAVAYAAALAADALDDEVTLISVRLSKNILKNVKSVGIPAPKGKKNAAHKGVAFVAALGTLYGDPKNGLDLLSNLSLKQHNKAWEFAKNVQVDVEQENDNPLYIEVRLQGVGGKTSRIVIVNDHTNVVEKAVGGKTLFKKDSTESGSVVENCSYLNGLTVKDIIKVVEAGKIDFSIFKKAIKNNGKIAKEGLKSDYGLKVGKSTKVAGWKDKVARFVSAGIDARMSGAPSSVVTNSGSGNRGIIATNAVVAFAENYKKAERGSQKVVEAVAISNLVASYIHQNMGSSSLSFLCGAVVASAGAAAGMTYFAGGSIRQVENAAVNVLASLGGMFCDGAKSNCALKGACGVYSAIKAFEMAINDDFIKDEGIAGKNLIETVSNLALIQRNASSLMNDEIYKVCCNCRC